MHRYSKGCRRQALYLLLLSASCILSYIAKAQSVSLPAPERITDRQGLPQAFITGIIQDQQGFMWVATRNGLCRYDGHDFRIFQPDPNGRPSLSFTGLVNLVLDHQQQIWIVSERGDLDRFDPRTETFTNFSRLPAYQKTFGQYPLDNVWLDRRNRLWIASFNKGVGMYDVQTGQTRYYPWLVSRPPSHYDNCAGFAEDGQGRLWAITRQKLVYFDEDKHAFAEIDSRRGALTILPDDEMIGLYAARNGQLLIGTRKHLLRFNPQTAQTQIYPLPPKSDPFLLMQFTRDSRGIVYFQRDGLLYRFTDQEGPQLLSGNLPVPTIKQCRSLCVDRSDVLWIGTNGGGIRKYDLNGFAFQTSPYQAPFHVDLLRRWLGVRQGLTAFYLTNPSGYDFRYTMDHQQGLWFNAASKPFQRLDLVTGRLTTIPFSFPVKGSIGAIYPLATDPDGRVWVAHDSLAWWYQADRKQWMAFRYPIRIPSAHHLLQFVVDQDALWVATSGAGLYRIDRRTGATRQFVHDPANSASLSSDNLFCLSVDPLDANRLWVGTFGSGLCAFDKRTGQCRRLTEANGLPNNVIYSALPDQHGYLWMGTNKGLVRMHRKTFQMRTFTHVDGLLADEFNRFHFLYLPGRVTARMPPGRPVRRSGSDHDDRIFMGGLEGIIAFHPSQIRDDSYQPATELTQIQVNNQPLKVDTTVYPAVQMLRELELPYNQNFLTVKFAVMQYNKPDKNRFRYQLEGLDDGWIETSRPEAIYTDLRPGRYVLRLNSTNTSGIWSPHVRTLAITIQPPFWATWWAYVLYGLSFLGISYWGVRSYADRLRLQQAITLQKQTMALQEREAQHLREVDEIKTRFFSNITHEFRTPLTLILGPVQHLQRRFQQTNDQRQLGLIERNANQLLTMINQLLDLSKLEASAMPVQESVGDLGAFVDELIQPFQEQAERRRIALRYQPGLSGNYWFDQAKLERIVYNLVANALKFTRSGGCVDVRLTETTGGLVQITVADTGVGIPADKLSFIFDRFYQVPPDPVPTSQYDKAATGKSGMPLSDLPQQPGTGIGLALVISSKATGNR